jgi:hypothetical protein
MKAVIDIAKVFRNFIIGVEMKDLKVVNGTFKDVKELAENNEGLVMLGCGGELEEWVQGIHNILLKEGIVENEKWCDKAIGLTSTGGRTDLLLNFAQNAKINIGKMAMWRLAFGSCSWLSDYVVNYADHFKIEEIVS